MNDDEPDFIERAEKISENWTGEAFSPERTLEEFHLYGHAKRAAALDQFDTELANTNPSNLRRYAELNDLHRRMRTAHANLRSVGR